MNPFSKIPIYLILCFSIIFSNCSTKKVIGTKEDATINDVWQSILNHNLQPCRMAMRGDIDVQSPDQNVSANYDVRMVPDSLAVVSVKKFGLEIARLKVDHKEYTLLYRLESAYEQKPLSYLKNITKLDLDFDDFQQLLMGNIIVSDTKPKTMEKLDGKYILESKSSDLTIKYFLHQSDLSVSAVSYMDNMNRTINITFENYQMISDIKKMIAYKRTIEVTEQNKSVANITIECDEILPNDNRTIKFSIPSHYEKI